MFTAASPAIPSFGDLSYKAPVRLVVTSSLAPNTRVGNVITADANGALGAIDGVAPAVGDRILVRLQLAAESNGIYTVTDLGSAGSKWSMTRATDANLAGKCVQGTTVLALAGSLCALTAWVATAVWTLNVTDPVFVSTGLSLGGASTFVTTSSGGGLFLVLESDTVATPPAVAMLNRGDAFYRLILGFGNGLQLGGDGTAAVDVRLFRTGAGVLQLDDTAGNLTAGLVGKAPVRHVYAASTTWPTPAGIDHIEVELVGGGGQGGGAPAVNTANDGRVAAGGGAGGYARKVYPASVLSGNYTVTVGAGGSTGGAGAAGQAGGLSSFAGAGITTLQGNGGGGANASAAERVIPTSDGGYGAGGAASGGDLNLPGNSGGVGLIATSMQDGGKGGASMLGPGGDGFHTTTTAATSGAGHAPAGGFGGGGGGASGAGTSNVARAGGAGAGGAVIVTEYYAP